MTDPQDKHTFSSGDFKMLEIMIDMDYTVFSAKSRFISARSAEESHIF